MEAAVRRVCKKAMERQLPSKKIYSDSSSVVVVMSMNQVGKLENYAGSDNLSPVQTCFNKDLDSRVDKGVADGIEMKAASPRSAQPPP